MSAETSLRLFRNYYFMIFGSRRNILKNIFSHFQQMKRLLESRMTGEKLIWNSKHTNGINFIARKLFSDMRNDKSLSFGLFQRLEWRSCTFYILPRLSDVLKQNISLFCLMSNEWTGIGRLKLFCGNSERYSKVEDCDTPFGYSNGFFHLYVDVEMSSTDLWHQIWINITLWGSSLLAGRPVYGFNACLRKLFFILCCCESWPTGFVFS